MKRLSDQTLYEILEIPQDASAPAIEAAVERARALYGPGSIVTYTLMSPEESALLVARIDEARRTLLDPEARTRYDASLAPCQGEVRAAVNGPLGGNGVNGVNGINGMQAPPTPAFTPIPVIPALKAPEPPVTRKPLVDERAPDLEAASPVEQRPAAPAEVAQAVAPPAPAEPPAAPLVEAPAPAPVRVPIRLDREISPPAAAPVPEAPAAAAPAAAPAPAEAEAPMPEGGAWTGEALRRVREARGITVPQIAERTKVTRHHVENIEAERYSALPAPVYLRGILLSLARELRLDGQKVARAYLDRAAASGQLAKPR